MTPTEFEQQIKKIHNVLVQNHGIVTWNDKILDPDNPKQSRQIDITVGIDNKFIHIECRHHKKPQDTKWIEELYGRKISLNADQIIGVSSSGFTEGAIKKANRLGIFICHLKEINEDTIRNLGKQTVVTFTYYKFSNLEIGFYLHSIDGIPPESVLPEVLLKKEYYDVLFNQIKYTLSQDQDFYFPYGFNIPRIECQNISIFNREIIGMSVRGDVDKLTIDYLCPFVWMFELSNNAASPLALVEKASNNQLEIIKSQSGFSEINLDLSLAPQSPPNSVFYGVEVAKLPGSNKHPPKFNIIGFHEHPFILEDASFIIADIRT